MPEKSTRTRAKAAKKQGIPLTSKADRAGTSRHHAKKSSSVTGKFTFVDRNVSEKRAPGVGRTRRSERLPEPGKSGSTSDKRATRPAAAKARKPKARRS